MNDAATAATLAAHSMGDRGRGSRARPPVQFFRTPLSAEGKGDDGARYGSVNRWSRLKRIVYATCNVHTGRLASIWAII